MAARDKMAKRLVQNLPKQTCPFLVGYGLGPLSLFAGVDKPVAKPHDQSAAHDVAQRGD